MKLVDIATELKVMAITTDGIRDHGDRSNPDTVTWQFDNIATQLHVLAEALDKISSEQNKRQGALTAMIEALREVDSISL
jgi:hypothetical protein